jgi:TusE/DsrC/DsvC family sulfur relay protein
MTSGESIVVEGRRLALDEDGHLADPEQWSREFARKLAEFDGTELGTDHWWVIEFVREYHHTYGTPPLMRVVVTAFRTERDDSAIASRDLYRLFSDNPIRQACRYAGLKKPDWCI